MLADLNGIEVLVTTAHTGLTSRAKVCGRPRQLAQHMPAAVLSSTPCSSKAVVGACSYIAVFESGRCCLREQFLSLARFNRDVCLAGGRHTCSTTAA